MVARVAPGKRYPKLQEKYCWQIRHYIDKFRARLAAIN